ncbi:MAG: pyridoxamine 5'-phosphate oxidase family protein [Propionibacteriaceae bacterium]|jgi:uncharacterized pyridoxamine 5'-phosphate oxidase family protein|nr:pyridoxamine 5'-phosphate oxidase family protein [Propionibacteriaceae bacterium]
MKNAQDVYGLLQGKPFFLATTDPDGNPHVRPFGAIALINGDIYLCSSSQKAVFAQLSSSQHIEIACIVEGMTWLRLTATAWAMNKPELKEAFLKQEPGLRTVYEGKMDTFRVIKLTDATATLYAESVQQVSFG